MNHNRNTIQRNPVWISPGYEEGLNRGGSGVIWLRLSVPRSPSSSRR